MAITAESAANFAKTFIPIILGTAVAVVGLLSKDVGIMAFGAGMIGAPSVIKAVSSSNNSPAPAEPAKEASSEPA